MAMTSKELLDRVVRTVPFVIDVDLRDGPFDTLLLCLHLWKGGKIAYTLSPRVDLTPGFLDMLVEKFAWQARESVSKALEDLWDGTGWKGILQHEGFEKIIPLANPLPLIRYDIPASLVLDIRGAWDNEETMVPTLPQRRIEFHLQTANSQTRVAYYSSQR